MKGVMRGTRRGWMVLAAVLTALAAVPASAASQGQMPGRRGRADLEQRVRARFGQMVRERLNLNDEQAQRLGQVVQGFQDDRAELARNEEATRRRVQAVLLETNPDQAEARKLLDRMSELREQEIRLSRQEQDSLLTVLSPSQLLRFNVLREEMGARIRQLRGRAGPGGRGPRGGGGSGGGTLPAPWGLF